VLGIRVDNAEVARILDALDMTVTTTGEGWQATPPSRRFDIGREEDLIEEVARIHGYDRIPTRAPAGELALAMESEQRVPALAVAEQLVARDYREAICMAFVGADLLHDWGLDAGSVALANPLSADLAVMRPSLLPGLVEALRHNRARQQQRVRLFELGHVFSQGTGGVQEGAVAPQESTRVAMVACGSAAAEQWGEPARPLDFHDIKGDLASLLELGGESSRWSFDGDSLPHWLHPGRGARVLRDGVAVGVIGALHPRLAAVLDLGTDIHVAELALDPLRDRGLPQARPVPRFPSVRRDIAVELPDSVTWATVAQSVRATLGKRLDALHLFDRYSGKGLGDGRKSFAMGLILQDASRTLTDEDADRCVAEAVAALERDCMARLRG
jgi:phenylalanyl-tRNA synthetase beta chain